MTPEPTYSKTKCDAAKSSLVAGYTAGAEHLKVWINACAREAGYTHAARRQHGTTGARADMTCALRGYAGGWALIRVCEYRTWYVRKGVDACQVPVSRQSRAAMIRAKEQS